MKFKRTIFTFAFILSLFTLIYALENNVRNPSVVWISLEKESIGHLEYATDITAYIASNHNITYGISDKFLLQSFQKLFRVYLQNPNPDKTGDLKIANANMINIKIGYNLSHLGNPTQLTMRYRADKCGFHNVSLALREHELYNAAEMFIENITACIMKLISGTNSSYVFIGTDHGLSLVTFKAAKKISPQAKIGIIVFDEHVDIHGTKNENNIVGKENVFGKLLIEGYADYVVFLQASESAKEWAEHSVDKNFTKYDIFKKMEIYSDRELMDGRWQAALSNSIRNMKENGVTNIMISIDMDVLPTRYTGFEYSIMAPAIAAIRFGNNRSDPSFAEIEEGFSKGLEPVEIKNYIRHIKYQTAINNIKFGVADGSTIILGDIQELLPKQDLNNETAKAAKQVVKFFAI